MGIDRKKRKGEKKRGRRERGEKKEIVRERQKESLKNWKKG